MINARTEKKKSQIMKRISLFLAFGKKVCLEELGTFSPLCSFILSEQHMSPWKHIWTRLPNFCFRFRDGKTLFFSIIWILGIKWKRIDKIYMWATKQRFHRFSSANYCLV